MIENKRYHIIKERDFFIVVRYVIRDVYNGKVVCETGDKKYAKKRADYLEKQVKEEKLADAEIKFLKKQIRQLEEELKEKEIKGEK